MRIAAAQFCSTVGRPGENVDKMRQLSKRVKSLGAEWVVFPELADTGYVMSVIREEACSWESGPVSTLRRIAGELELGIIAGVSEREGDSIFNTQIVVDRTGDLVARYRKMHLFAPAGEDKCFAPGEKLVSCALGDFRAGLGICYDLRFPEFHRALAVDHGANLFVISSAWPVPRAEHLRILSRARAIENQSYVVLANRVGTDNGTTFGGGSAVIDPSGAILAEAGANEEEIVVGDISLSQVESIRAKMPVFSHRRLDVDEVTSIR